MNYDKAYWLVFTAGAMYFALAVRHATHYCQAWHLLIWAGCGAMALWFKIAARRSA